MPTYASNERLATAQPLYLFWTARFRGMHPLLKDNLDMDYHTDTEEQDAGDSDAWAGSMSLSWGVTQHLFGSAFSHTHLEMEERDRKSEALKLSLPPPSLIIHHIHTCSPSPPLSLRGPCLSIILIRSLQALRNLSYPQSPDHLPLSQHSPSRYSIYSLAFLSHLTTCFYSYLFCHYT
ncbi:hypothetical protein E2C01_081964 [Portunus trituberculatus]|uniref:Uncharacterized protein n=1 Tax=Portunus trituberculatus TaxID=210409 RepID=A0A5B7J3Q8_PORTR|nr:hypothetical protein [Portunus trituberculatus]